MFSSLIIEINRIHTKQKDDGQQQPDRTHYLMGGQRRLLAVVGHSLTQLDNKYHSLVIHSRLVGVHPSHTHRDWLVCRMVNLSAFRQTCRPIGREEDSQVVALELVRRRQRQRESRRLLACRCENLLCMLCRSSGNKSTLERMEWPTTHTLACRCPMTIAVNNYSTCSPARLFHHLCCPLCTTRAS